MGYWKEMNSFFLTTAIDYVNGRPHLGHAYEKVLADSIARFHRNQGEKVFFLTGVDEHGQKVQKAAKEQKIESQAYCDEMSAAFRVAWEKLQVSYDHFVRTTDPKHKKVVREFLQKLYDDGQIYFTEHEGYYSVRQEQFVTEKDMVNGQWPEIYGEVIQTKEPNYFFRLTTHQEWLCDYIENHPDWIYPAFRRNEVLGALQKPLNDLCISRPKSRLEWGIPLPFDENYVTYVWFDALVNYISFSGWGTDQVRWPANLHVIGKDIMVPAHLVYWPIMLKALGLPQPKRFLVHGWWQMAGEKMSKSTGNVVDPLALIEQFGGDAFRYYVLRDMAVGQDADFSVEGFFQRYRSDLANDLGNLVNRTISMIHRYRQGTVPAGSLDQSVSELLQQSVHELVEKMKNAETHLALERIWRLVQRANQFVEEQAPWKLAKESTACSQLDMTLMTLAETVRILSILIEPFLPATSRRIQEQLGLESFSAMLSAASPGLSLKGRCLNKPIPLFPRIEETK